MRGLVIVLAMPALVLPPALLGVILVRGWPGMGQIDALLGQLSGSLLLAGIGCSLATPIALGLAVWLRLQERQAMPWLRLLQLLQGVPPLVFGLCGMMLLVQGLHWGMSLMAGGIVLAVVVLPQMSMNYLAALERVPREWTEAARSLGLDDPAVVLRVWLPGAWQGLLTGLLLGLARSLAETAPVLFTAAVFSGVVWPTSLWSPVTTLQTHIFYLAQEGIDERAMDSAWTAAAVLVTLVLIFSLSALWIRLRSLR